MKNNDEFTKSWVRTCPPFEHCPDWKAFRPMLSTAKSVRFRRVRLRINLARALSGEFPLDVIA